jgi:hypothetical protein
LQLAHFSGHARITIGKAPPSGLSNRIEAKSPDSCWNSRAAKPRSGPYRWLLK